MAALVLNGKNISVKRESRCLVVTRKELGSKVNNSLTVALGEIDRVIVSGHPSIPVSIFQRLMKEGIPVGFVSERGYWYGTLNPGGDGNGSRRMLQYRLNDRKDDRLHLSSVLIARKIKNQRRVLQRLASNRKISDDKEIIHGLTGLKKNAEKALSVKDIHSLLGMEGSSSAAYFKILGHFFPDHLPFTKRLRKPPGDEANALLSWTYTIVLSEIETTLRRQGLDPVFGWLHGLASGRSSLALDLLEPFRPACDMLVINLLNRSILDKNHFYQDSESSGVYLNEEGRRKFFIHYEKHMERKFKLQGQTEQTSLRQCILKQTWNVLKLLEDPYSESNDLFLIP